MTEEHDITQPMSDEAAELRGASEWPDFPDPGEYDTAGLPPMWGPDEEIPEDQPLEVPDGDHPFWDARPELRVIHDFAKAQMASPHAVFAAVLARVIAATPHNVVLPATIGGNASLNLFIGFVAESGGGKGIAEKVAGRAVFLAGGCDVYKNSVVSGEAFTHIFATRRKRTGESGEAEYDVARINYNALITIGEIDQLGGLKQRQGSTIMPTIRSVAMGEHLGGGAATEDRKVWVEGLTYRCCLMVGIQPARSGVLFGDVDGGTPQRFLFVAANDPEAVMDAPLPSMAYRWQPPDWSLAPGEYDRETATEFKFLRLPQIAVDTTKRIQWEKNRGLCDALDGHRNLLRLKVAAGLAILAGRTWMDDTDWGLSDFLMRHSDRQRERCGVALMDAARLSARAMGRAEAHRDLAKDEEQENTLIPAVAGKLLDHITAAGDEGVAAGKLAGRITAGRRAYVEDAIDTLLEAGKVERFEHAAANHTSSTRYRRARTQ